MTTYGTHPSFMTLVFRNG